MTLPKFVALAIQNARAGSFFVVRYSFFEFFEQGETTNDQRFSAMTKKFLSIQCGQKK
jgi:hypothetical protein